MITCNRSIAAGVAALALGCVAGSEPEATTQTQSALATVPGNWTLWPTNVKLCFTNPDGVDNEVYMDRREQIIDVLEETWGAHSPLSFTDAGECPSNVPGGVLPVDLWESKQGGWCGDHLGPGPYTADHCFVSIWVPPGPDRVRDIAVHEIGHSLGLPHEHQRATSSGASHERPLCERLRDDFEAEPNNGDLAPQVLQKLTEFDPLSVMNYCAVDNGRTLGDHRLTELDALGIEMLYPWNSLNKLACWQSCFKTGDGFITRASGSITLDWTVRGGLNLVPNWDTASGGSVQAQYLPVSQLGSLDFVAFAQLRDWRQRWIFSWPGQRVVIDDNRYAAVLSSLL